MDRPTLNFRQAQAAFDLIWILQHVGNDRLIEVGGDELVRVVCRQACRFESVSDANCYENLLEIVLTGSDGVDVAVSLFVANDLQRGLWNGDSRELASCAKEKLISSPRTIRTSILRGLDALEMHKQPLHSNGPILRGETRCTHDIDQILPKLISIARLMDQDTRKAVASADYGKDVEEHLSALENVLISDNCLFPSNEAWFPQEVVELVSHVPSAKGFIECTALLLANALQVGDKLGWFEFRWSNLAADYVQIEQEFRMPIFAGLRHLFELGEFFFADDWVEKYDPVNLHAQFIEFVSLEGSAP